MLLPRWGEFCSVGAVTRAVPMADGVCPFRGQGVRSGEIGNGMVWGVNALINLSLKRYGVFHVPKKRFWSMLAFPGIIF